MLPTLHDGEIFVLDEGAYKNDEPKRGDIVVFSESKKPDYFYIKRVIGLPGEHLDVTSDGIFIEEKGSKTELAESYLAHAEDQNKNYALDIRMKYTMSRTTNISCLEITARTALIPGRSFILLSQRK
jgi:signal peptidase I